MLNFSFRSCDNHRRSRSSLYVSCGGHSHNCVTSDSDTDTQSQSDNTIMDGSVANEYNFIEKTHADQILSGLNELRKAGQFCDVSIQVDNKKFPAHRSVLSAYSPYFKAMFGNRLSESRQPVVVLNGVGADMVELLIDYCYSGTVTLTKANCQSLLSAANLLQVLAVRDAACAFLEAHMDPTNCLGIHCFAETHACLELADKAKLYALANFNELMEHGEELINIPAPKLIELTSSDRLNVPNEETVFQAIVKWFQHSPEKRRHSFPQVLSTVRLPLLSPYFLVDFVARMPAVRDSPECMELVEEAKIYHLVPDRRAELGSVRTKLRTSSDEIRVIVIVGGEDDKVVLRTVECYSPEAMTWTSLACLPMAVSKHGLVSSGKNILYLVGGEYPDGSSSRAVWRYEPNLDKWLEMAMMGMARSEVGTAMLDGYLYAVGGWEGSVRLSSVERYDPSTNRWTEVKPMKVALTSSAVIAHKGFLYVTGGAVMEDGDAVSMVQRYNPLTDTWSQVAEMNIPRSGAAVCSLGSKIYVVGGWHASMENTNRIECYDTVANKWEFKNPMIEKRYRPGIAVMEGKIYVFGGEEGWDKYHDTIECYDPNTDKWTLWGEMQTPRSWLGCVTLQVRKAMLKDRS